MGLHVLAWVVAAVAVAGAVAAALLLLRRRPRPPPAQRWPGPLAEALRLVLGGERERAAVLLRESLEGGDEAPGLFLALGLILRLEGDPERAAALHRGLTVRRGLRAALRAEAWRQVALDSLAARRPADALEASEQALRLAPDDPLLLALDRDVAYETGDLDRALSSHRRWERASDREDLRVEASLLAARAGVALRRGERGPAKRDVKRALKADASGARARFEEARLEAEADRPGRAAELLRDLLAAEPGLSSLLLPHLAEALQAVGDARGLEEVQRAAAEAADRPAFACGECGARSAAVRWRCTECGAWERWARAGSAGPGA